ncbi:MAG: nickel-dependent hydrogenase large subunit [Candidatus Micrarchaeia archaeon]
MHKDFEIHNPDLSKMEGHASIDVVVRNGEVRDVNLKISESKRFYTQAIRGKPALGVYQLVSRICGTCSIAHLTCCIESLESAMFIRPSQQTLILRELSMIGTILRDHAMHLYLFCLPDLFDKDSVLDFDEKETHWIEDGLQIKKAGNSLSTAVAGRAVHALFPQIGGFSSVISNEKAKTLVMELKDVRELIIDAVDLFYNSPLKFESETNYIALTNKDFSFTQGNIMLLSGVIIQEDEFVDHLHRVIIPYSQATGFKCGGMEYRVGSLARMNLNRQSLHRDTKKDVKKMLSVFPSNNIFDNELAQAIEMLHCVDKAIEILETTEFKPELPPRLTPTPGTGIGVVEAPRGTLYYELSVDNQGLIKDGTLVIPTAQNQVTMECDIGKLVQADLQSGKSKEEIEHNIEKLIRAYDPCMSCATHFLKVNWK